ncbi:MAG: hypothetical protein HQK50_07760 [Oligoflexia bacterium]|nr:hypothetical protein [Oligoflexia bacterium]
MIKMKLKYCFLFCGFFLIHADFASARASAKELNPYCLYDLDLSSGGKKSFFHFCNLLSQAVADGVVTTSSLQGLASKNPCVVDKGVEGVACSTAIKSAGPYFQAMQFLSQFDYEILRQLEQEESLRPLPGKALLVYAPLEKEYVQNMPEGELKKHFPALNYVDFFLKLINPLAKGMQLPALDFKNINANAKECALDSKLFKQHIADGAVAKLLSANQNVYGKKLEASSLKDLLLKVKNYHDAFTPLALVTEFQAGHGYSLETYLPPPTEIEESKGSYRLKKGLKRQKLPFELKTTIGVFDDFSYLPNGSASGGQDAKQMIQVRMNKDFKDRDNIDISLSFGRVASGSGDTAGAVGDKHLINIDSSSADDSLQLYGKLMMQKKEHDGFMKRKLKQFFNKFSKGFLLEVQIHQLGMKLQRKQLATDGHFVRDENDPPELPYAMKFSMPDSKMSYSIKKNGVHYKQMKALSIAGFKCQQAALAADGRKEMQYDCRQDFATWKGFESDFLRPHFRGLSAKIMRGISRKVLHDSMPDIEKDLDQEINSSINYILEKVLQNKG